MISGFFCSKKMRQERERMAARQKKYNEDSIASVVVLVPGALFVPEFSNPYMPMSRFSCIKYHVMET